MGSAEAAEPTDAQLARLVLRAMAGVVALLLAAGVAVATERLADDGGGRDEAADDVVVGRGLGPASLSPRGAIGPLPGTAVSRYVRSRAEPLQSVGDANARAAVVSFSGYKTVDAARELVRGAQVVSLFVALPGGRPTEVVPDEDLAALVAKQRSEATAERKALEELLPTVKDPDFKRQYEADIARLGALLAAPTDGRDLVFGAVVVGTGARLRIIAHRPGVRLVDVGASASAPRPGASAALRPEETAAAGDPPVRRP
jgi:hypothetical protein